MMRRIRGRIARKRGFTLAETLLTILILLMVAAVVAGGIPAAKRVYDEVIYTANAQVLLSSTVTRLRDKLGEAKAEDRVIPPTDHVTFVSSETGLTMNLYHKDGVLYLSYTEPDGTAIPGYEPAPLVTEKAAAGLYASCKFSYEKGIFTVTELKVCRIGKTEVLAELEKLVILAGS